MEIDNNPYFKKAQELTDKFAQKRADDLVLWSPKWDKMDTTEAPKWWPLPLPT